MTTDTIGARLREAVEASGHTLEWTCRRAAVRVEDLPEALDRAEVVVVLAAVCGVYHDWLRDGTGPRDLPLCACGDATEMTCTVCGGVCCVWCELDDLEREGLGPGHCPGCGREVTDG